MSEHLRLALCQINTTVGDIQGNGRRVVECLERAEQVGCDLVLFPELTLPGYPPEDLVLKPDFVRRNRCELERVAAEVGDMTAVLGFVDTDDDIHNAAAVIQRGKVIATYHKCFLPNYAVFDEQRYFRPGRRGLVVETQGVKLGITICEDIWYPVGPASAEAAAGAEVIININASPFSAGRQRLRERMITTRAQDEIAYVAYLNLVGGQDELVFEGASLVVDWNGEIVARCRSFEEDFVVHDLDVGGVFSARLHDTRRRQMPTTPPGGFEGVTQVRGALEHPRGLGSSEQSTAAEPKNGPPPEGDEEIYRALVLGVRDYVDKNGFKKTVIGLSGGIDSSVAAAVAVGALGPDRVVGVSLPSRFSSSHSVTDAEALANNLGIQLLSVPIEASASALIETLADVFKGKEPDITEENIQARVRGTLWMALSNKFGWLVLTTGNKSEIAVGFSTLYGDTAGGFAVLKDVYKTTIYRIAEMLNRLAPGPCIPEGVLTKPPSAELRADQLDVDRLPPYDELDPILQLYVEEDRSLEDIVAAGHDRDMVMRVIHLVDANEFKRRQQPPGPRVTTRAFGKDRRLPITNGYRA